MRGHLEPFRSFPHFALVVWSGVLALGLDLMVVLSASCLFSPFLLIVLLLLLLLLVWGVWYRFWFLVPDLG